MQSNFGPADGTTVVNAWATPTTLDTLLLPVADCSVVEAHTTIRCLVVTSVGVTLTWRVVVEGQSNTLPLSSTAAPSIARVTLGAGAVVADTAGGTALLIAGDNFGAFQEHIEVSLDSSAGRASVGNCTLAAPHTLLLCVLPPGTGVINAVTVAVLGQSGSMVVSGLAYAPPVVRSVSPAVWGTDLSSLSVELVGSGFGTSSQASAVQVTATASVACVDTTSSSDGSPSNATLVVTGERVTVRSDTELTFVIRYPLPHIVASWTVVVTVGGQNTTLSIRTAAPSAPVLGFFVAPNGTHVSLALSGQGYGSAITTCASDVSVTLDGAPCLELTMERVRWCNCSLVLVAAGCCACCVACFSPGVDARSPAVNVGFVCDPCGVVWTAPHDVGVRHYSDSRRDPCCDGSRDQLLAIRHLRSATGALRFCSVSSFMEHNRHYDSDDRGATVRDSP